MNSLPYELLQHISGGLLPKYQCRFALISRHHYQHLYNDLLRWHVKSRPIKPPNYKCMHDGRLSLLEFNKQLILHERKEHSGPHGPYILHINNLTKGHINPIDFNLAIESPNTLYTMDTDYAYDLCLNILNGTNILTGCYKYLHRIPLLVYINSRNPLLSLSYEITNIIEDMLSDEDRRNLLESSNYLILLDMHLEGEL